jgi:hypothetical protein
MDIAMPKTQSAVPWTVEEVRGFETLNTHCLSVVPVHLFPEHSIYRPHKYMKDTILETMDFWDLSSFHHVSNEGHHQLE